MLTTLNDILHSWKQENGVNNNKTIDDWIKSRGEKIAVTIEKIPLEKCSGWMYDSSDGSIRRNNMAFFAITGLRRFKDNVISEQPIILQPEIGYLGIICKTINGVLHFLMQAKIEPGNINTIQISPTIQATKSNFTQKHGGSRPPYLDHFLSVDPEHIIVDQIQSEQSSRFLGKRNRNIIIEATESDKIEVLPSHIWMTLGQIKRLMLIDNCVNMDTRTVLSCLPIPFLDKENTEMLNLNVLTRIYSAINNYKMFEYVQPEQVPLLSLKNWKMTNDEIISLKGNPYKVIFCDIAIEGREVKHWCQPLFEAIDSALFGLFVTYNSEGKLEMLVQIKPEIGCFDGIELGPTVQKEGNESVYDSITYEFIRRLNENKGVYIDVMQSEEGGRFYHEQNRNVIILVNKNEIPITSSNYTWCDFTTLNYLLQINNCVNIQLRSLVSLFDYNLLFGKGCLHD